MSSSPDFTILPPAETKKEEPKVRYSFPTLEHPSGQRIAVIGPSPSSNDLKAGRMFSGADGDMLFRSFMHYGISREGCLVGAIARTRNIPFNSILDESGKEELEYLTGALDKYNPNICVLVGETALVTALDRYRPKKDYQFIEYWRGSVFEGNRKGPFLGRKCIGVMHPVDLFNRWDYSPLFFFDVKRAAQQSTFPELRKKERHYDLDLTVEQLVDKFERLCHEEWCAMDIEGYVTGMSCVSYAPSSSYAFIVPWGIMSDVDRKRLLPAISKFHASRCKKILQNGQYDNFVFTKTYRSFIRHHRHDTQIGGWELLPELPKALDVQISYQTDIAYYKDERNSEDRVVKHRYCCTDSLGTYEVAEVQRKALQEKPLAYEHFCFNMALMPGIMYLELRGMLYDRTEAARMLAACKLEIGETTMKLEKLFNRDRLKMLEACKVDQSLDPSKVPSHKAFNPASVPQTCQLLYDICKYPKQFSKPTKKKPISTITSDTPALLELAKTFNGPDDTAIELMLKFRHLAERRKALEWEHDPDGRMRASYDCVGTVTGRFACRKSPMNTGANLQTATKPLRKLFRADPDCVFLQCDLSGADGWTVAAHAKALGDPTMYDDYMFGLKPAKLIAFMYLHGSISGVSREELAELTKDISEKGEWGWLYFACKRVQHGTNYLLGLDTMADQILKDSHKLLGKAIVTKRSDNKRLQSYYKERYPGVELWQKQCNEKLLRTSSLTMASGHTRRFFGRKADHATFREFTSTEPQANTTQVTNRAFLKLWCDPENRKSGGTIPFHVEPLHQVHDALNAQVHKSRLEWAIGKLQQWFYNPITIAGQEIVIPFEGEYGPSWGELGEKYGGGKIPCFKF